MKSSHRMSIARTSSLKYLRQGRREPALWVASYIPAMRKRNSIGEQT